MRIEGRWLLTVSAAIAVLAWDVETHPAFAQRAAENAVTQSDDAFGTSVGNEQVGLYSPRNVRGFSPTDAGNIRIEGLYFDQVTELSPRLQESSRIRVGIAAQGYAFPAPTGVVDYALRKPGHAAQLNSLSEINNRGTATLELDGALPLMGETLSLGQTGISPDPTGRSTGVSKSIMAGSSAGGCRRVGICKPESSARSKRSCIRITS